VPRRRALLTAAAALIMGASCLPGFDPPSKVDALRVLAVTADRPYAQPGDDVTLRMTVHDALGATPRPIQVVWLAGCVNPEGDQYYLCFDQLAELLAPLAGGALPPADLVALQDLAPESSGVPDGLSFTLSLPDDIVSSRPPPDEGPHYGIAYVFFAACAGTLAPAPLDSLGGDVPELPLRCLDPEGNALGPESFVPGYTQIYAFADGRTNANPPAGGITLDGTPLPADPAEAPIVEACPLDDDARRAAGCGATQPEDVCRTYDIEVVVGDVAEPDPDGAGPAGEPLREIVWATYFADGGTVDPDLKLVSDATTGYVGKHATEWVPPAEPGLVALWAVVRDQRGGQSIVRRFARVP
jgi:hypothetical protein